MGKKEEYLNGMHIEESHHMIIGLQGAGRGGRTGNSRTFLFSKYKTTMYKISQSVIATVGE
jgi:hypothetical protein